MGTDFVEIDHGVLEGMATHAVEHTPSNSVLCLNSNVCERDITRVGLHADEPRVCIGARGLSTVVTAAARETSRLLPIEPDDVVLAVHLDLVMMPLPRREV